MRNDQCQDLVGKIKKFRTVVLDFDSTLTTSRGNLAECAGDVVRNAKELAVNTFNSEITPAACCTDEQLVSLGFCPNGKCRVDKKKWAYRRGKEDIMLNGKKLGTWHDDDIKGRLMREMKLSPETTLFFDDNAQNIRAAEKYGYNATKVDGRSGLNGREEITPP